jgi:hypothetical protein
VNFVKLTQLQLLPVTVPSTGRGNARFPVGHGNPENAMLTGVHEPSRLYGATRLMLDELEDQRKHQARLACRLAAARDRGAGLVRSLDMLIRALPPGERDGPAQRLARIEGQARPALHAIGATPASSAVLAFLAGHARDTVTVPELTAHLKSAGLTLHRRYAACSLNRLIRQGLVARVRRAVYRINRYHPELMAVRAADRQGGP